MSKSDADYFADWEGDVFGFGYGTGEPHTVGTVRAFLDCCKQGDDGGCYDYRELELGFGPVAAWLLINVFCHARLIEYGSSPRFGWLTKPGRALQKFMLAHSMDDLLGMLGRNEDDGYIRCYRDVCNCGPNGHDGKRYCDNPFW